MNKILLCTALLISGMSYAQITITSADFAAANDTVMVSTSDETSLDFVTTGADVVWDFSTINIPTQTIDTFHSVAGSAALYQAVFNNAWFYPEHESDYYTPWFGGGLSQLGQFGIGIESPVQFTAVLSNQVKNTGIGFYIQGQGIPGPADTIDIQYELPMNYSDAWTSPSYIEVDLNPAFDAIYTRYQIRNSNVDGWGTVITPFGSFDALRVRSHLTSQDSIYVGFLGGTYALPTPDRVEYHWFTNGQKIPIFSITTTDIAGTETITEVKFKDKKRDFASVQENAINFSVYPNPTAEFVTISTDNVAEKIEIFDAKGSMIYNVVPTSNQLKINTTNWDKGIYLIKVDQQNTVSTSKLVVQ
ncbi:T9SS type A sorting domain-containing protein [Paracrocinitomix mangrovi]|uniref:T9SS type A sorting domain-containing protein n=1 Tax=Paracrocinitomix mangrovi TaxID=2862509 RepID=UPI001C8CF649|nr:T9SS type A sorting domain-containing protein [Paracrocinitomix mangrovi]UKN03557.1 T9SS type A sorting domain-containing protein [Paracrocinitomix mangrovi]